MAWRIEDDMTTCSQPLFIHICVLVPGKHGSKKNVSLKNRSPWIASRFSIANFHSKHGCSFYKKMLGPKYLRKTTPNSKVEELLSSPFVFVTLWFTLSVMRKGYDVKRVHQLESMISMIETNKKGQQSKYIMQMSWNYGETHTLIDWTF